MPKDLSIDQVEAGDSLDSLETYERILACGAPGSGKSDAIVRLALDLQDTGHKLVVIDRDRGIGKAVKEICGGGAPENLTYFLAKTWDRVRQGVSYGFKTLTPGDWLVFDMLGPLWDFAQNEYARMVYGEDLTDHILLLRADAQKEMDKKGISTRSIDGESKKKANSTVSTAMAYSGMEGRTDWSLIKRMHNDDVLDRAILHGEFNILATTSIVPLDDQALVNWPLFKVIGKRPEGEKHNVHRFDTIAFLERNKEGFTWRTDLGGGTGKDRGRPLYRDIDFTDAGFIASYLAKHGIVQEKF
jgi:hypothetical protein